MEIPAGLFKSKCLSLMDQVQSSGEEIIITKRGKPVAKLVPVDEKPSPVFGRMKGTVIEHGDIVTPTGEKWDADA